MSQLLAVLNGPAFYPLPGIGRTHLTFAKVQLVEQPSFNKFVGCKASDFGEERRAEIVKAISEGHNTRSLICKATGIPFGSLYIHIKKLLRARAIYVAKEGKRGHTESEFGVTDKAQGK